MKMTVSLVSVLFLMTISFCIRKSSGQVWPLDMAENSVDDSYGGCRDDMNKLVISEYIEYERKNTPGFAAAWENALNKRKILSILSINQSAAIYMYTAEPQCRKDCSYVEFNKATRNGSAAYQSGDFQFYTLHFFLTDAVQQLKKEQTGCVTSYRRTRVKFETDVLNKKIRFGSFTSSSLNKDLTQFGRESCFQIYTCFGAAIESFSEFPSEKEVLIPPYETFLITAIKEIDKERDLWCNVVYELKSAGKRSDLQCIKIKLSAFDISIFVIFSLVGPCLLLCLLCRAISLLRNICM
ncbi:NAD(P)(+)--arginine ADP-ribosyltransferase 1-like [Colossoma macropomum]|uniref:NAD(P)(+)--arginine ADP-ribosyltransferase 1-like n=1 Tax=Colossoma macropomum TaxID=42526 RepID=UPI001863FFDD|nr:NAD(P)(+)--arginine ADP-ribosyltransferase 1-like [Colossoma macropomum]